MMLQARLEEAFSHMGWVSIPEIIHHHAEEAAAQNISYLEFLDKLLQEEMKAKRDRFIRMKTRLAHLPYHKTMEQFDFSFQPSIDERRIRELATLRFVQQQENLILLGPPGVGKNHLSVALALEAIKQGLTVYFTTAHDLVQTLQIAHQNNSIKQKMRAFIKPNVLIIDEIGYRKMDETAAHFFFQIVSNVMNLVRSFSLRTSPMVRGERYLAMRYLLPLSLIDYCIIPIPSTLRGKVFVSKKRKKLVSFGQSQLKIKPNKWSFPVTCPLRGAIFKQMNCL